MQISGKILGKWQKLRTKGDNKKLAELLEINQSAVSRILNGKAETTDENIDKIANFFSSKKKRLKKIESI
jgi:plasmid maintenance system antidote protein VapI